MLDTVEGRSDRCSSVVRSCRHFLKGDSRSERLDGYQDVRCHAGPKLRRDLVETDTRVKELMGIARSLEGLARHASTHAAGVVISEGPLTDHVPLYKGANDEIVTQSAIDRLGCRPPSAAL